MLTESNVFEVAQRKLSKIPLTKDIPCTELNITRLGGGANFTFLVTSSSLSEKYILKLTRQGANRVKTFLNRPLLNEYENGKIAHQIGVGVGAVYIDHDDDTIVFPYIDNSTEVRRALFSDHSLIEQATLILRTLHTHTDSHFINEVDTFDDLNKLFDYVSALPANEDVEDVFVSDELSEMMVKINEIDCIFKAMDIIKTPCHGDINPKKFLLASSQLTLVDWEYSGNNDPANDLATFSVIGRFSEEQEEKIFETYASEDKTLQSRFFIYKALTQLFWYFWFQFQIRAWR